jgi:VanZ family protein
LVLVERLRHFKMNPTAEWWLNNLEHIFFALVVGFMLYMLLAIFWLKKENQRLKRAILVFLLFNAIGLINEWNQNHLCNRPAFVLIADSVKDLKMNLIGSSIFFLTVLSRTWWLKKNVK